MFRKMLVEARRLLVEDGWTQRENRAKDGAWCLSAALQEATHRMRPQQDFCTAVQPCAACQLASVVWEKFGCSLVGWNDDPKRTKGAILTLLDEVIAKQPAEEVTP